MLSFGSFMDRMLSVFCDERALTAAICHNLLFLVAGPNPTRLNKVRIRYGVGKGRGGCEV